MSGFRHTNLGASKTHVPNSPGLRLRFQALLQVVKVKHRLRPEVDQKQQTRTPARLDIMFLYIYIYVLIINICMGILLIYYTYMYIYMPRSGHIPNVVQTSVDSLLLQGEANQATKQRLAVNCSFPLPKHNCPNGPKSASHKWFRLVVVWLRRGSPFTEPPIQTTKSWIPDEHWKA